MSISPLQQQQQQVQQLLNHFNQLSIQTNDYQSIGNSFKTTSPLNTLLNATSPPVTQLGSSSSSSSSASSDSSSVKDEQQQQQPPQQALTPSLQQQQLQLQQRNINTILSSGIDLMNNSSSNNSSNVPNKCDLCKELIMNSSKLLWGCYHVYCVTCIDRIQSASSPNSTTNSCLNKFMCPLCSQEIRIVDANALQPQPQQQQQVTNDIVDVVEQLTGVQNQSQSDVMNFLNENNNGNSNCFKHKSEQIKYFCSTCSQLLCKDCVQYDQHGQHEYGLINEIGLSQLKKFQQQMDGYKLHLQTILTANDSNNNMFNHQNHNAHDAHTLEQLISYLNAKYQKATSDIDNMYQFYKQLLDERKQELKTELDSIYSTKQILINNLIMANKNDENLSQIKFKIDNILNFTHKLMKQCTQGGSSLNELLIVKKPIEQKLQVLIQQLAITQNEANLNQQTRFNNKELYNIEFVVNYSTIQPSLLNTCGYLKTSVNNQVDAQSSFNNPYKPKPIGPPAVAALNTQRSNLNDFGMIDNHNFYGSQQTKASSSAAGLNFNDLLTFESWSNGLNQAQAQANSNDLNDFATLQAEHLLDLTTSSTTSTNMRNTITTTMANAANSISTAANHHQHHVSLPSTSMLPARSQIKRQKMIYNCKFGEFGINDGQFTEPSGVAINQQNDIIVADTNSHRIQIFDRDGHFKFKFGECGKREGQLLYPNRVSIVKQTGDIIVTERSPTHQIQIYNQYGLFIRKFGANILQHPRGVCVDAKGNIIVVECKVMRVIIFDQYGNVIQKFSCSKYLEFPNGVCVNDKQEIFISDNRAHSIKVFNYAGQFLRQIGGEGITNYPIGVGINSNGEVLVADNHNNFNLTVFTQDGQLINALESKVKHAQCFDVGLMDDGSIVLASKDYRIYVYRYISTAGSSSSSPTLSSNADDSCSGNINNSTLAF